MATRGCRFPTWEALRVRPFCQGPGSPYFRPCPSAWLHR